MARMLDVRVSGRTTCSSCRSLAAGGGGSGGGGPRSRASARRGRHSRPTFSERRCPAGSAAKASGREGRPNEGAP